MKSKIPPIFQHCRRKFYTCQLVNPNKSKKEVPAHDGIHQQILEHADSFNKEKPAKTLRQSENHPASPQNQPDRVEDKVKSRKVIIPGKVAVLKGDIESKLPGWEVIVAPLEAVQLVKFMKDLQANGEL